LNVIFVKENVLKTDFKPENAVPVTNSYNESITYDKNGNIITLNRNGVYDDPIYELEMDNLSYFYSATNPNQLVKVNDSTNNPNGFKDGTNTDDDYSYDANGNMLTDKNKGITSNIKYNHLNLPVTIDFGENGNITYIYNALGQKVRKDVCQGELHIKTDYLNGFQYEDTRLEFFPTAEGYVKYTRIESAEHFNYVYNYTDHLGNIRLSYGLDQDNVLKILEENNYYPFGLKHDNYNINRKQYDQYGEFPILELQDCVNCSYKYKYNGKELQDELGLNMYTYGFRDYDPAIGRWVCVDPLAEKSRRWSPYNYCVDNPIRFIDPDGREIINIKGGVRFTGNDAQILFKNMQQLIKETGTIKGFHFVQEAKTKTIYKDLLNAFRLGKPNVLHMIKNNPQLKNSNREKALDGYPVRKSEGLERQEYPYATTYEGGKGSYVTYVPEGEQRVEGGQLSVLSRKLNDKDAFMVIPVPKDREPDAITEPNPSPVLPPVRIPAPTPEQTRTVGAVGTVLTIILMIALSPVGI